MREPVITVRNISKSYKISHELKAEAGNLTFRDAIVNTIKKPKELITGHITKKEKFWALKDINFEINRGEVVGVIGKNGSGKSTLLKIMSRITEPTTGEIVMNGKVASLLEVGTGFHPELTGRENVYFNGSILGMKKKEIDAKFDEIVAFSEVEKFLDTPVKFYSSGMYVRLAFSVAAHLEPDILIIDEVLAVGDAAFQKKCLGKMQDVAGEGRTVLFVSHNMSSIKSLCNKAIWLDNGRVLEKGEINKVTDGYNRMSVVSKSELRNRLRTTPTTLEAKFIDISIKNLESKDSLIDPAKPIAIEYTIESQKDLEDKVDLHSRVTSSGQPIISLLSEYTNSSFQIKKGKNNITCIIEPTMLTGGVYSIDCSILYHGKGGLSHIDEIFDAKTFTVNELKINSNEIYITQRDAIYYVDHKWSQ